MDRLDKIKGCLLGGAAGDALGYTVEFYSEEKIFSTYGASGITEYTLRDGVGRISDDTQMTAYTAIGLLWEATKAARESTQAEWTKGVRLAYGDWREGQEMWTDRDEFITEKHVSWIRKLPFMNGHRAPGGTCLGALNSKKKFGTIENRINDSKGCGGVMRVAPIALYLGDKLPKEEVARLGAEAAALTHGHDLGFISAAALVHIVGGVAFRGQTVREATQDAISMVEQMYGHLGAWHEQAYLLKMAMHYAAADMKDLDAIKRLGAGWVAEETLAIAVYCAIKHEDDFEKAIVAAVNHQGDSDSTGAVTGNILGARLGLQGIPQKYLDALEGRAVLEILAQDLCDGPNLEDDLWLEKYETITFGESLR